MSKPKKAYNEAFTMEYLLTETGITKFLCQLSTLVSVHWFIIINKK